MSELSVVGKSVHRLDDLEKVTGTALFCADIMLPRMLYAKVLRSPHPHARLVSINTAKAERVPGVKCVATGRDAPNEQYGMVIRDQPVLAKNIVRFVGEPVAAVSAESMTAAEEAIALIKVKYEPLPPVFDPEIAMSRNCSTVLHPNYLSYPRRDWLPGDPRFNTGMPNVFFHFKNRHGDVEKGFQEADVVMENRFSTHKLQHAALEPHAMIARPEADGGLTVHSARQNIWHLHAPTQLGVWHQTIENKNYWSIHWRELWRQVFHRGRDARGSTGSEDGSPGEIGFYSKGSLFTRRQPCADGYLHKRRR